MSIFGMAVTKSIRALVFVFRPGETGDRFTLDTCTGWVRHMITVDESGTYTFGLDVPPTKGEVELQLLDKDKQPLLKLDRMNTSQTVNLVGKSRYYLRWEFKGATGNCEAHWQVTESGMHA